MKKAVILVWLLCIVFGIGIFMARPVSADAGFVINEGILQKYTGNAEKVVIPGNVTIIGTSAFDENDTIKEVEMPANLREIQSSAFQGCDNLKKVTMNDKVTKLGQMCFRNCVKLESIVIPESVNFIGSAAFQYCNSLKSINIPQKVTTIEYGAFSGCSNLTEITVSESNAKYKSVDGVLFDSYESTLVSYPAGKKEDAYTVPDGIYAVERQAFWEATNLTEVILPDSVRTLNEKAFSHCKMISEMRIPASVAIIDNRAFEECRALRSVYIMNDRVSFGADVFKGAPGVELYGGIGSAAEEYAGLMRIVFHVIDTKSDSDSEKPITESASEKETKDRPESSEKDLTHLILFLGIVLAACLVLLFGILTAGRIGQKGEDSTSETENTEEPAGRGRGIHTEQDVTIAFGDQGTADGQEEIYEDPDGTVTLGTDGINAQPDRYGDQYGTHALGINRSRNYWQNDTQVPGGAENRNYWQEGTQVPGGAENRNYWQEDQAGMKTPWQSNSVKRGPGDPVEQNGIRKPQLDDLETEDDTVASGIQGNVNRSQGSSTEQNDTVAYGAQRTVNRDRHAAVNGSKGITRRETSSNMNAGSAGRCTCTVCGTVNDSAQNYCWQCGAALTKTERTLYSSPKETDEVVCACCGIKNRKGDRYCIGCGARL